MPKMVEVKVSGDFKNTKNFLKAVLERRALYSVLDEYGERGLKLLVENTPKKTGETAASWRYEKVVTGNEISLAWYNSKLGDDDRTPVVILIINGHGTRTGGYVPPNDFISPIMENLLQEAADAVWKVVTSL